jgi:hypothetical protein
MSISSFVPGMTYRDIMFLQEVFHNTTVMPENTAGLLKTANGW